MANTSSAKKAARKIARRAKVNGNRISRVRTHVRKVDEALASGDKTRRRGRTQGSAAGTDARRVEGRDPQEDRVAESFATRRAREGDRRKTSPRERRIATTSLYEKSPAILPGFFIWRLTRATLNRLRASERMAESPPASHPFLF